MLSESPIKCRQLLLTGTLNYKSNKEILKNFGVGEFSFSLQKVQVGKDQEKAQSEKDSHSKNRGGKKPN